MSDTPRTDAEALRFCGNTDDDDEGMAGVGIRFAREQELKIARMRSELDAALAAVKEVDDGWLGTERSANWRKRHAPIIALALALAQRREGEKG